MAPLALLLLATADEALDQAVARTSALTRYAFTRRMERDGEGGADGGAVDGPLLTLKNALGTLYRKGAKEVLLLPSGAVMPMEALPEGPTPSPHAVVCALAKGL